MKTLIRSALFPLITGALYEYGTHNLLNFATLHSVSMKTFHKLDNACEKFYRHVILPAIASSLVTV